MSKAIAFILGFVIMWGLLGTNETMMRLNHELETSQTSFSR